MLPAMDEPTNEDRANVACGACGAANPADAKFCRKCGEPVLEEIVPSRARRQRRAATGDGAHADRVEKIRARQEFTSTRNTVLYLRSTFIVGAMLMAIALVPVFVTPKGKAPAYESPLLWGLFFGTGLVTMAAGAVLVLRQPLLWSVIIACLWTLYAGLVAVTLILIKVFPGPLDLVVFLLVPSFWAGVMQAARVQRLLQQNPDFSIERRRVGQPQVEGGVVEKARAQRRQATVSSVKGRLKLAGIAVGVLAVGILVYKLATAPPSLESRAEAVRAAWTGTDDELFFGMVPESLRNRLGEALGRRGWHPRRPAAVLDEVDVEAEVAIFSVERTAGGAAGTIEASFRFDKTANTWLLTGLELPALRPGDPQKAVDAFRAAWKERGFEALVALQAPDLQRRARTFERLLEQRLWTELRPSIDEAAVGEVSSDGSVEIEFATISGIVETEWKYWHPDWQMTRFAPPPRR